MEESRLLDKVIEIEDRHRVNDILVKGIPLWRIVRYKTRFTYINSKSGFETITSQPKMVGRKRFNIISNLWRYIGKKNLTLFYPFNRLVQCNGLYLDKFIDPVIEESFYKEDNYVIIDPPCYGDNIPRLHRDNIVTNEARVIFLRCFIVCCKKIVRITRRNAVKALFNIVRNEFELSDNYLSFYYDKLGDFLARYYDSLFWFHLLNPKRVFVVLREGYFPQIAACKKLGIPVAEFQHGITMDNTISYAGKYDGRIDPDFFITFGDYWNGPQFGMPVEKIFSAGWAYKDFLAKSVLGKEKEDNKTVLAISSTEISDQLLDAIKLLSEQKPDVKFHIRLHPCEQYNEIQMAKLASIPMASLADNKIDCALALSRYSFVIGENSSVIYEALSSGCKVAMLNFCGLRAPVDKEGISTSFVIINNPEDFELLFDCQQRTKISIKPFYSDFDGDKFSSFVNEKM